VLIAVAVVVAVTSLALVAGPALLVRSVRRRNRVSRQLPTFAPTRWLWSPFRAARLHRRLRHCVATVDEALPRGRRSRHSWPALTQAADQLGRHAADVDAHLVAAHYAGTVHHTAWEVDEVERLAARLLTLGRAWGDDDFAARRAQDLRDRIEALEQATREVDVINRGIIHLDATG
jgi:hypothetical protein